MDNRCAIPDLVWCPHCRRRIQAQAVNGMGITFGKGWHTTYVLQCGHTVEVPHKPEVQPCGQ